MQSRTSRFKRLHESSFKVSRLSIFHPKILPLGKTPSKASVGDRFIPNRSGTNFDVSAFKLLNNSQATNQENLEQLQSPQKLDFCKTMAENLNGDLLSAKILSYKSKPPVAPEGKLASAKGIAGMCSPNLIRYTVSPQNAGLTF